MTARLAHVVMPQMGESLSEGTIVRWLKAVGDRVDHDEPLFELSTDKVDTDVPAPAAGVLTAILVAEGETVTVGTAVAVIETDAAESGHQAAAPAAAPASQRRKNPAGTSSRAHAPQLVSFRRDRDAAPRRRRRVDVAVAARGTARSAGRAIAEPAAAPPANRSFSPAVLDAARRGALPSEPIDGRAGFGPRRPNHQA